MSMPTSVLPEVVYPESDGKPMGKTPNGTNLLAVASVQGDEFDAAIVADARHEDRWMLKRPTCKTAISREGFSGC